MKIFAECKCCKKLIQIQLDYIYISCKECGQIFVKKEDGSWEEVYQHDGDKAGVVG